MAQLRVSPDLLAAALFRGVSPEPQVRVVGASFDAVTGHVLLELQGADVPADAEHVHAVFRTASCTVEFVPC